MLQAFRQESPSSRPVNVRGRSFRAAVWRFAGLWLLVSLFAGVYSLHPYYQGPFFAAFHPVVTNGYVFFCGYGFF